MCRGRARCRSRLRRLRQHRTRARGAGDGHGTSSCIDIDGRFNSATGYGYIPATDGDYARALALGVHVELYNFETFGGFGKGVTCLLKELSAIVMNKLTTAQYEETTWGARGWLAFQSQRLSVKLHLAVAYQIGQELGLAACRGADPRDDAC